MAGSSVVGEMVILRQLQPDVALRVGFQLRRKRPKNESLNDESRCQTEWPSDQKPTGALFHVAVGYRPERHAFGSNEQNHSVVRRKTEWHFASRACPNGSRVVAVREAELTHWACESRPMLITFCLRSTRRSAVKIHLVAAAEHIAE